MLLGLGTFGRSYKLSSTRLHGPYAPITGPGIHDGVMTFAQVCEFIRHGAQVNYVREAQVPYAHKTLDWVSYENEQSLAVKVRWLLQEGFLGLMTSSLNQDDWGGQCRKDGLTFPLHRTINRILRMNALLN